MSVGTLLHRAVRFAAKKHFGQDRNGIAALPYLLHPMDVLHRLRYDGGVTDESMLAAAVLHDVIEESGVMPQRIRIKFGARVAELVMQLTREEPAPEDMAGLDANQVWAHRTKLLLDGIRAMGPDAMTIKLCDRLSNLAEAMRTRQGERLERYVVQTRLILEAIPREVHPVLWDQLEALMRAAQHQVEA